MFTLELLHKIAVLYYKEGMIQEDIARKVGISRPMVSRALERAREQGIVRIEVVAPKFVSELSVDLASLLGLDHVEIAPSMNFTGDEDQDMLNDVAEHGAKYLEDQIRPGATVGLGWGRTVYKTVMNIVPKKRLISSVKYVPLVGSLGRTESHFQVNIIVNTMASKLGGSPFYYNVSTLVAGTSEQLEQIKREYSEVFSMWKSLDVAIVGLGVLGKRPSFPINDYNEAEQAVLRERGVIGDMLGCFFNKDGFIDLESTSKGFAYVGIPPEDLAKSKKIICLVSGKDKLDSIITASRMHLFNELVVDEKTANCLAMKLKEDK
ncbi:MAG: sugar-binding domain-containing protein [Sphaerochaetaceae bacterium]|jgi:deoxyribonucleoside regulator|nr:sugar-binding domain-containing protein [Sphaerochaetaceae bacterium]